METTSDGTVCLELLKSPTKQSVDSFIIVLKAGSHTTIASFFYENSNSFYISGSTNFVHYGKVHEILGQQNPF